eukprot:SAG31_NODE_340_length_17466_cov_5.689987_6_plen_94_part_00
MAFVVSESLAKQPTRGSDDSIVVKPSLILKNMMNQGELKLIKRFASLCTVASLQVDAYMSFNSVMTQTKGCGETTPLAMQWLRIDVGVPIETI